MWSVKPFLSAGGTMAVAETGKPFGQEYNNETN
jgi:hypothetical protein